MRDDFLDFVLDQLAGLDGLRAKRMFGAHGLYLGGMFVGIVADQRLFFKNSDATRQPYLEAGMTCFQPTPRQTLRNYFEVPANVVERADELRTWAQRAAQAE